MTLVTGNSHHLLLLTASFRAFICENLKKKNIVSYYCVDSNWLLGKTQISVILTFLFLCAGSDLQSRSMCSPTLMSGISPLLTGMGVLHKGHTGTWISYRDKYKKKKKMLFKKET